MFGLLFLAVLLPLIDSCYIWGTESGYCSKETLDPLWRATNMKYCQGMVLYPACLPKKQSLPVSLGNPVDTWKNVEVVSKDNWVQKSCDGHIVERMALEGNKSLQRKGTNEFGDKGRIKKRFSKNPDCQIAYKNLFCWINFPRCDPDRDLTYPTCRSACENYFKACNFGKDLWRCGNSKFFNGYSPEAPIVDSQGNTTYLREYFPGQPFRKNVYSTGGSEIGKCTPAITGSASSQLILSVWIFALLFLTTGLLYFQSD